MNGGILLNLEIPW